MIKNLKEIRESKGISQKELAEAVGIKPTTYNSYEKLGAEPKIDDLKKIAIYLNTSLDRLCDMPTEQQALVDKELERLRDGLCLIVENLNRKEIDQLFGYCASLLEKRKK